MKKLFLLVGLFTTAFVFQASAQNSKPNELQQKIEKVKEMVKPQLMAKANLTSEQADKVILLHVQYANRLESAENATPEQKAKLKDKVEAAENKEYLAIPLTVEQIKLVNEFWASRKKS